MKMPEGYIAFVEELPCANTQAETLEEARSNLVKAVAMVLDANRELSAKSLEGAEFFSGSSSSRSERFSGAKNLR